MFYEDVKEVLCVFEIILIKRDVKKENLILMCGVLYYFVDSYIDIFVNNGYKVVICE